jgi:hypothetical protein
MLRTWARGDFDAAHALFDDGVVTPRAAPDPGTWHGHEGLVDVITTGLSTPCAMGRSSASTCM